MAASLLNPASGWTGVPALRLIISCSSSPLSDPTGEPIQKSSPKFLWKRGLTDLVKEEPLMVLSFILNIEGLAPKAGEDVLDRGRDGAGDAGACGR